MTEKAPTETASPSPATVPAAEIQFDCIGCNAPLRFSPGTTKLVCSYCGSDQQIKDDELEEEVREFDFAAALERHAKSRAEALVHGGHEVHCEDCGAHTVLAGQAGHCPYCDAPVVVEIESTDDRLAPDSVLPFVIERRTAEERFGRWVKGLWFAPSDLEARAKRDEIDGVYLPYWTYDSVTSSHYRGQRGDDYWEDEWHSDGSGRRSRRRKRKTRWTQASGTVEVSFDDVLVYASDTLPRKLIQRLEPWDLDSLEVFDPAFLSGFIAELYHVDLEAGFTHAEKRMKGAIHQAVRKDIGGDRQRIRNLKIEHDEVSFKHCLLPLWISSFRYKDKVFRFLVNAQTGEITGERPVSGFKILFTFLFIAVMLVTLIRIL